MSAPQPLIPLMLTSTTHPTLPDNLVEDRALAQQISASRQQMQQSAQEQPGRLAMQAAQLLGLQTQVQGEQQELQDQQKWRAAMADPSWDGTTQDLINKGLKQGVGAKSLAMVSQGLAATGEAYAKLGTEQLKLQDALGNHIGDQFEAIQSAAPKDKLAAQQQAKQNAITWVNSTPGLDPHVRQNFLGELTKVPDDVYVGDDALNTYVSHLKMHSTMVEEGLKTAQTAEATGKGAYQQAEAGKIAAQQNPQSPLYAPSPQAVAMGSAPGAAQIQTGEAQQAGAMKQAQGQVTPSERFTQQNENYREQIRIKAAQGQGAALANVPAHLVAPASAGAEKIGQEYADAVAAGDDMNTFLSLAAQGNKIAYSYAPTEGVLTLNTAKGVKRVNLPEIQSYAGAGSAGDRIQAFFGKQTSGASIPDDVLKDMGVLHQALTANAQTRYNNKLKVLNQTYGSNFQPTQLSSGSGGGVGGGGGGPVDVTDPNGGIHRFPDQKSADAFKKAAGIQ